jgi:hypothetical protein
MESAKIVQWFIRPNPAYPKELVDVYMFDDVQPGETKQSYYDRKQLTNNMDYIKAMVKLFVKTMGVPDTLEDLVPEEYSGQPDWHVTITAGPVTGSLMSEYSIKYEGHCFIPTLLTKEEHYKANPPTLEYLHALLKVLVERCREEGWFFGEGNCEPIIDNLIPHVCGGALDWDVQQML